MDCKNFRLKGRGWLLWRADKVKYFAHLCDRVEEDSGCSLKLDDEKYCDIHIEAWVRLPEELPQECWELGRWVPGLIVICGCKCPEEGCGLSTTLDAEGKPIKRYADLPFQPEVTCFLDADYWVWEHGNCLMYQWEKPYVYQAVITRIHSVKPYRRGR